MSLVEVLAEAKTRGLSPSIEPINLVKNILKLNAKIKNGYYKFEKIPCFCGNDIGELVVSKDRYGIFYDLNLCPKCGILYASPRMTEESSSEFYQSEYRSIYDFGQTKEGKLRIKTSQFENIKAILDDHEIDPKIIFDIGCNNGTILAKFEGKETYGVDIDESSIEYGKSLGRNLFCGGMEKLEELNKKADLIILNHVLEHFNDIKKELERISKLIAPDGVLYVALPGLYAYDTNDLLQNAHNWQFNTKTLTYVMRSCGWDAMYADAQITSLWKYTGEKNDDLSLVVNQAKEIWEYKWGGEKILPSYDPVCKFSLKERRENVRKTLAYKLKDISDIHEKESGKEAVVVGGGPSIEKYIDKIKEMQKAGKVIVSIERMYQWCQDNGIVPNYILAMDASDDVLESFGKICPETTHILATQCKPEIFELLKDENTYIYSSAQSNISFVESWEQNEYKKVTMLNTGGSVSLGCLAVSMFLGMKKIHVFGFDCHVSEKNYANGITGVGYIKDIFEVEIDGREFKTTPIYVSFARQFFDMWQLGKAIGLIEDIKIYGDSMVKAMSKINIDGDGVE